MERFEQLRTSTTVKVLALGMGLTAVLAACSWNDFNPSGSATHNASRDGGATQEILANYPDAHDITVTHADDNPNYMSWELENGETCTAFASMTQNKGKTPGSLISEPYCREVPDAS